MHLLRTRFGRDIVAEYLPPQRPGKSIKVAILCDGMPSVPAKKDLLKFFSKKGFWVFLPRYRGAWESSGTFLKHSPHLDVLEILRRLGKFKDGFSGKAIRLKPDRVFLIGASFGGAAALLCANHPAVDKVLAFSPVVDWRKDSKAEPIEWMFGFVRSYFGQAYRMDSRAVRRLKSGKFYNPAAAAGLPGYKILIIQPKDDKIVSLSASRRFAARTKARLLVPKRGGHLGLSALLSPRYYKIFSEFVRSRSPDAGHPKQRVQFGPG